MATPDTAQRIGHFADGGACARRFNGQRHQILGALRGRGKRGERRRDTGLVAAGTNGLQTLDLLPAHLAVVDPAHLNLLAAVFARRRAVAVHADDSTAARIDLGLRRGGDLLDPHFRNAGLDRGRHAAKGFHLGDMRPCPRHKPGCQAFEMI